jgi:Na+/pantothenate symporter
MVPFLVIFLYISLSIFYFAYDKRKTFLVMMDYYVYDKRGIGFLVCIW